MAPFIVLLLWSILLIANHLKAHSRVPQEPPRLSSKLGKGNSYRVETQILKILFYKQDANERFSIRSDIYSINETP